MNTNFMYQRHPGTYRSSSLSFCHSSKIFLDSGSWRVLVGVRIDMCQHTSHSDTGFQSCDLIKTLTFTSTIITLTCRRSMRPVKAWSQVRLWAYWLVLTIWVSCSSSGTMAAVRQPCRSDRSCHTVTNRCFGPTSAAFYSYSKIICNQFWHPVVLIILYHRKVMSLKSNCGA